LEDGLNLLRAGRIQHDDSNDDGGPARDQESTITFILANKARGWKVALRKTLMLMFGQECMSNSCAAGRKYAKS